MQLQRVEASRRSMLLQQTCCSILLQQYHPANTTAIQPGQDTSDKYLRYCSTYIAAE
jgi:hypothetical protein